MEHYQTLWLQTLLLTVSILGANVINAVDFLLSSVESYTHIVQMKL